VCPSPLTPTALRAVDPLPRGERVSECAARQRQFHTCATRLTISNSGRPITSPRRGAPGCCGRLLPDEGERSAEKAHIRVALARRDGSHACEARRASCDRRARLSALHCGDFGPGAALPSRAFPPDQFSDAPRSQVVVPGRGPGPSEPRLRAGPQNADPRCVLWDRLRKTPLHERRRAIRSIVVNRDGRRLAWQVKLS
jgi:hypothetical protein